MFQCFRLGRDLKKKLGLEMGILKKIVQCFSVSSLGRELKKGRFEEKKVKD